jgi:eukaryotic-like serine/threonine-protein kinase
MSSIRRIIVEAHRRSLWQVLGIYLVGAWIVYEVIGTLYQTLALPDWVPGVALVLFLIGLPIVLATAFVQEGAPRMDGLAAPRRDDAVDPTLHPELADLVPAPAGEAAAAPTQLKRVLTWNRSLSAGILAFAVLGLSATGFMGMRALGVGPAASLLSAGVLEERDPILLADFGARGVDTVLAEAVTEALRVDLEQSEVVRLYDAPKIRAALARMERPGDSKLHEPLALELAQREGLKAVLLGDLTDAGGSYVLTARLIALRDGAVLASYRELAADGTDVIPAVDRLSRKLRGKIGESLRSVRRSEPLEGVTTASLEALKLYSQAVRAFANEVGRERSIALLQEAIAHDSTFAMAWRKLGVAYQNDNDVAPMVHALSRAYELRDRLTDRERYHTTAAYASEVEWDEERAVQAYRTLLERYPDDHTARHNLGLMYSYLGRHAEAADAYARAIATDSGISTTYRNLRGMYAQLGRFDELEAVSAAYHARWPEHATAMGESALARGRGDWDAAERALREWRDEASSTRERATASLELASVLSVRGRISEARRLREEAAAADAQRGALRQALDRVLASAWDRMRYANDTAGAVVMVEHALEQHPLASMQPLDRPWGELAVFFAFTGDEPRARHYLDRLEQEVRASRPKVFRHVPHIVAGEFALRAGRGETALREFRAWSELGDLCRLCPDARMGHAFDRLGHADSAVARYGRVVADPASNTSAIWELPLVLARIAELHDAAGRTDEALANYSRFTDLWRNADADLQPRVRSAQRRVEFLLRQRG